MRPIEHSGLIQDAYGRWYWWTIDDVGFYEKRAVAMSTSRPLGNPWRHAWTRAKHLRRAAEAWRSHGNWVRVNGFQSDFDAYLLTKRRASEVFGMAAAYREAAKRADWGTRP